MKRTCILLLFLVACTRMTTPDKRINSTICLTTGAAVTRAADPDETLITDYNLLIFNSFGILEEKVFYTRRQLVLEDGKVCHRTRLLQDVPYTILAAANLGYELPFRTLEEARDYRYHMAYPDEFTQGIPMAAFLESVTAGDDGLLEVPLERLMARIELSIDRSQLQADVQFKVTDVRVGACPSSVQLVGPSKVSGQQETFTRGYAKTGTEVSALNEGSGAGLSRSIYVYLLENCQGDLLDNVLTDSGKVFTDGTYREICSYIELKAEYHSPAWHTRAGDRIIYRFYLGESLNNFDVVRNTWYRISVCPRGDGLGEDGWRVNKEALTGS